MYICKKLSAEDVKKSMRCFFIERPGWVNIKISTVNISAIPMEAIIYNLIIKTPYICDFVPWTDSNAEFIIVYCGENDKKELIYDLKMCI